MNSEPDQAPAPVAPNGHARTMNLEQLIDAGITPVISTMINGMIVSSPGVPPAEVILGICRVMAFQLGTTMSGDIAGVLAMRKRCREAFDNGLKSAPTIRPMGAPANGIGGAAIDIKR